tara:strand:- start:135 stop:533 length:399 start_codon:yes stop_codon:yes gene_type:complete
MEPAKNTHGINFLNNRADSLTVNKTNKNDVIKRIGNPHTISINDENIWIYFERKIEKGKYYKMGQNVIKQNNILELRFNKYGILVNKKTYVKKDMNKVSFSKDETENTVKKKSFVEKFLSSVRQKMYGKTKF